jgi:hypothetical protein
MDASKNVFINNFPGLATITSNRRPIAIAVKVIWHFNCSWTANVSARIIIQNQWSFFYRVDRCESTSTALRYECLDSNSNVPRRNKTDALEVRWSGYFQLGV